MQHVSKRQAKDKKQQQGQQQQPIIANDTRRQTAM